MIDGTTNGHDRKCGRRFACGNLLLAVLATLGAFLLPGIAGASGLIAGATGAPNDIVETILCQLVGVLQGPTGQAIATVAVIGLGIAALLGKTSWHAAAILAAGVAILMGAGSVTSAIGGAGDTCIFSDINAPDFVCVDGVPEPQTANMFANAATDSGDAEDTASGGPFTTNNACNTTNTGSAPTIFASVLCNFKSTVGQIMTSMYCAMQNQLVGPVGAVITLVITILGIAMITGISNFTIKEAGIILFKLALVWAFIMNSAWAIGIGYKFFMGVAEEGADIVLSALADPGGQAPSITQPDTVFKSMFGFLTGNGTNIAGVDPNVEQQCGASLGVLIALMSVFLPIVPAFVIIMAIQYIALYARAMLGYLTAIVLIAFLFILSPFFISCALFKTTMPLFQTWVSFLTSFALQVLVIFGFLALLGLVLVPITDFFVQMLNLLRAYDKMMNVDVFNIPYKMCGICQYTQPIDPTGGPQCTGTAPTTPPLDGYLPSADGSVNVIPLSNLMMHQDLVIYVVGHIIALWLIANILQAFLKGAPELARQMGGAPVATSLMGVSPEAASVGAGNIEYLGMNSLESGLKKLPSALTSTTARTVLGGLGLGAAASMFSRSAAAGGTGTGSGSTSASQQEQTIQADYNRMQAALRNLRETSATLDPAGYEMALEKLRLARSAYYSAAGSGAGAAPSIPTRAGAPAPAGAGGGAAGGGGASGTGGAAGSTGSPATGAGGSDPAAGGQDIDAMRSEAKGRLQRIQGGMDASRVVLPPDQIKRIEAAIDKVQKELTNAKTEQSVQHILEELNMIQSSLV